MVGDSVNDVQAGAPPAGIPVVCVSYGYNEGRESAGQLECDLLLDSLTELPALLQVS